MTVLEVIQRSSDFLAKKGVESARLNAELLLAHTLKVPRLKLYLDFQRSLSDGELSASRELVRRRGAREPLQHIVGSTSFCGLEIRVSPDVLIPRAETEELAEKACQVLNVLPSAPVVLDFATGSGCLALAIAASSPTAFVHACDISEAALQMAQANAVSLGLEGRINFHQGDGFASLPADLTFDVIVSNPPYIPSAEIDLLTPEVCRFDPRMALDGGTDGLDFYRRLAIEGAPRLNAQGQILMEFGDGQAPAITALFASRDWGNMQILKDFSGRERILIAERPQG